VSSPLLPDLPQSPEKKPINWRGKLFATLNIVFIVGGSILMAAYAPAHALVAFFYAMGLTSPLILLVFLMTRSFASQGRKALYGPQSTNQRLGLSTWAIGIILVIIGLFYATNVVLDYEPVATKSYLIVGKDKVHRRRSLNQYDYSANVILPASALNPLLDIKLQFTLLFSRLITGVDLAALPNIGPTLEAGRSLESVSISEDEYASIQPNATQIILNIHPGLLGLPWYDRAHSLQNGAASPPSAMSKQYDKQRLNDPLSRRAENLSQAMLATFNASPLPADKTTLDHADLALSHLRWEYVYNGLSPEKFTDVVQQLERLLALGIPSPTGETAWELQANSAIAENRHRPPP